MDEAFTQRINVTLSKAEALVVFDTLSSWDNKSDLKFRDAAERQAFSNLLCVLESALAEPLLPNYSDLLVKAKSHVPGC